MYTGIDVFCPKIVVDQSTCVMSRNTLGRNHILRKISVQVDRSERTVFVQTYGMQRGSRGS